MVPKLIACGEGNPEKASIESAKLAKIEPTSAEITKQLNALATEIKKATKNKDLTLKSKLENQYDALSEKLKIIHALHRNKHVLCLK